jgi:hypothetical protein
MRRLRWPAGPPWWLCVVLQGASKDLLAMVWRELVRLPGADRDSAVHRKVGRPARVKGQGRPTSSDVGSQLARRPAPVQGRAAAIRLPAVLVAMPAVAVGVSR